MYNNCNWGGRSDSGGRFFVFIFSYAMYKIKKDTSFLLPGCQAGSRLAGMICTYVHRETHARPVAAESRSAGRAELRVPE